MVRSLWENIPLIRTVYPEALPRVAYTLTELGYSLEPVSNTYEYRFLNALQDWGEAYQTKNA